MQEQQLQLQLKKLINKTKHWSFCMKKHHQNCKINIGIHINCSHSFIDSNLIYIDKNRHLTKKGICIILQQIKIMAYKYNTLRLLFNMMSMIAESEQWWYHQLWKGKVHYFGWSLEKKPS